jgi:polysaccharide export outer membrane protein
MQQCRSILCGTRWRRHSQQIELNIMSQLSYRGGAVALAVTVLSTALMAQQSEQPPPPRAATPPANPRGVYWWAPQPRQPENIAAPVAVVTPPGYVIGPEDVLSVVFWRDKEFSTDVVVRPDGKISLPLLDDIHAAGLTPEELNGIVETAAKKFVLDAQATVIVKEIRSRKVYVVGEVARPGTVSLTADMNVLQVIAEVGGFLGHAKKGDVVVVRIEDGKERRLKFNYNDVVEGKNLEQNVPLRPGDTILVR